MGGQGSPEPLTQTQPPGCCRRRGEPFPLSPRPEGAVPPANTTCRRRAEQTKGSCKDQTTTHFAIESHRHGHATNNTQKRPPSHSPRWRLQEGRDAKAPPPPNPEDLGFSPGHRGRRERGMYLAVACRKGAGVQDVADGVTTAGQGFLPVQGPRPNGFCADRKSVV